MTGVSVPAVPSRPAASVGSVARAVWRAVSVRLRTVSVWLTVEGMLVLAMLGARRGAVGVLAVVVLLGWLVAGLGRRGGMPLYRLALVRGRFVARTARRGARPTDPRFGPLARLLPRLSVGSAPLRAHEDFGIAFDGTGFVAAVRIEPPAPSAASAHRSTVSEGSGRSIGAPSVPSVGPQAVDLSRLDDLRTVDDIPLSVQVLEYIGAAPGGGPPARATWVVLRLDPRNAGAAIEARGGGVLGAHRALKRAVGRACELLRTTGMSGRALDAALLRDALRLTLVGGTGWSPPPPPLRARGRAAASAAGATETWRSWQAEGAAQVVWSLAHWPSGTEPTDALRWALHAAQPRFGVISRVVPPGGPTALAATAPTFSSAVHAPAVPAPGIHAPTVPTPRVLVRAAADPSGVASLIETVERAAREAGATLRRLDGEHALGVVATLPLG